MKIKHNDIEIPKENPFQNCKLGRQKYGEILTGVIESYSDGFVLGIDSKWGTGKTTFVKMWKQLLENKGYDTLYFNAWTNDFDSNPLVAILSELKTLSPKTDDSTFKSLLSKGAIITKSVLPVIIKAIAEKYIKTEVITDAIEKITESAASILEDEIDEYSKKKKGLIDFKVELENYVKDKSSKKPIIFIVDELDRCRPNYSVEVLEQIKHFFNVNGITFILTIDKEQLGNAIKGYYGNENIDSNEYLRRFIDIEYTIPEPETGLFCAYLIDYYQFNDFFFSKDRINRNLHGDKETFLKIATSLFDKEKITLRQQEKIFAHARLAINLVPPTQYLYPDLFFLLVYIRDLNKKLYFDIRNKKLTAQQLIDQLKDIFPKNIDKYDMHGFIYLEARFVVFYQNYVHRHGIFKLIDRNKTTQEDTLLVTSLYGSDDANTALLNAIRSLESTDIRDIPINVLLDKIDLLVNVVK